MKIAATMVSMDAAKNYTEVDQNNTIWQQGKFMPSSPQMSQSPSANVFQQGLFSLIHSSTSRQQSGSYVVTPQEEVAGGGNETNSVDQQQAKAQALSSMVQHISGTSVTVHQVETANRTPSINTSPFSVGLASLTRSIIHVEQESICFQAAGTVQTDCGQTISFNMGVQMQRQQVTIQSASLSRLVHGIDPIVLNFDENISLFDENYFSFDLDGDGLCEELSGLGNGCGFLALDRDGDGAISDGFELFGPTTDNGFSELAKLDTDGNSWIDENDPIFDDLLVWMGAGGKDEQLVGLREAGVGAISVAHAGTQFTLENNDGNVQGVVRATGLFLMENGEPKALQELDLVPKGERGEHIFNGAVFFAQNEQAIEKLREIIFWQRFKLQMLLGKKQLHQHRVEMLDRLQHLSTGPTGSSFS